MGQTSPQRGSAMENTIRESITRTLYVRADKVQELTDRLTKLQKKAIKYDCPFTFQVAPQAAEIYIWYRNDQRLTFEFSLASEFEEKKTPQVIDKQSIATFAITITYTTIRHPDGWRCVGSIERVLESNNLVNIVEGEDDIPWRTAPFECVHCNHNRQRNKCYILKSNNNQYITVGSTCIADYLGIDATHILTMFDELNNLALERDELLYGSASEGKFSDDDESHGSNGPKVPMMTINFIAATIATIRKYGPYTKGDDMGKMSTLNMVYAFCLYKSPDIRPIDEVNITEDDYKLANQINNEWNNKWVNINDPSINSFEYTIATMVHSGYAHKHSFLCGAVGNWIKRNDPWNQVALPVAPGEFNPNNVEYLGNPGDRIEAAQVVIREHREISPNEFGPRVMIKGHIKGTNQAFTHFGGYNTIVSDYIHNHINDESITINIDVKKHNEWKGQKDTIVTLRCLTKAQEKRMAKQAK